MMRFKLDNQSYEIGHKLREAVSYCSLVFVLFLLIVGALAGLVSAQTATTFSGSSKQTATLVTYGGASDIHRYYAGDGIKTYFPILADPESCVARQDILLQVAPIGCQPAVVRSDLLAEQNVPVFCQIDALKLNPLIDVKQIRNIQFGGEYPREYVAGLGFHPAQAALRTRNKLLGSPLINNIGYVVIVLKRNPVEDSLPERIDLNLNAQLDYYSGNALGIGKTEFLLREVSDSEWELEKIKQSFFKGRYSVRLTNLEPNFATVDIYEGDRKVATKRVERGKDSGEINLPGSYCQVPLKIYFDELVPSEKFARLQIDDNVVDVVKGSKFLDGRCSVGDVGGDGLNGNVTISCAGKKFKLELKPKVSEEGKPRELVDKVYEEEVGQNLNNALATYERVFEEHKFEMKPGFEENDGVESYGQDALEKAIALAREFGQEKKEAELIVKYRDAYPSSKTSYDARIEELAVLDSSSAGVIVELDNNVKAINLKSVKEPSKKSSARFDVEGLETFEVNLGERRDTTASSWLSGIRLDAVLGAEEVRVIPYCLEGGVVKEKASVRLKVGEEAKEICSGGKIRVLDVDLEEFAKVRMQADVRTSSSTNFTVSVGIEKRAIQLSPEKTRERIDNLEESIKKWEQISNNLANVVKGLKGACFATAGVLTVKNFFAGLDGSALAREKVMRGKNGWSDWCAGQLGMGTYDSLTQCFNDNAAKIGDDVNAYAKAMRLSNDVVSEIEKNEISTEGLFGGKNLDVEKAKTELFDKVKGECSSYLEEGATAEDLSYTQIRDLYFDCLVLKGRGGAVSDKIGKKNIEADLEKIQKSLKESVEYMGIKKKAEKLVEKGFPKATDTTEFISQKDLPALIAKPSVQTEAILGSGMDGVALLPLGAGTSVNGQKSLGGGNYLLGVKKLSGDRYSIEKIALVDDSGSKISEISKDDFNQVHGISALVDEESVEYHNRFLPGEAVIRFYEREPYKGMPAIVPFDGDDGWYVATRQSGIGELKSFDSSGRPVTYWVCNIGSDNRVGFLSPGFGDDTCRQFFLDSGQPVSFPGLSKAEASKLVERAERALRIAADQRDRKRINTGDEVFEVGEPAASVPGTQCQDFMSPEDCLLLFNVCDPVICPSSRCDFGGQYPVADVIQTGIVGSALLCLPNVNDGVVIPVCLTGVQAGIDGYVSILKQHQACLQENLDTGRTIGICDAIYSIYMCEFFWRQAAPIANVLVPKVVEFAYTGGQGHALGGGEYLTVQSAWDNAQQSVDYFTNEYAVNSLQAFNLRSVDEAGGQFCKAFVSAKGPDAFETLIEPDSPPQFHAWFSSFTHSDATVPATAQYKVFYHIFAGNDAGRAYSVYLKDAPQSSFYNYPATIQVATDFVTRGDARSDTRDFTAPEGYKQLCVRIDGDEECGFGQVTSSFAIDVLRGEFVKDELTRTDIKSETACISGQANAAALLSPNVQEAGQELLTPDVYNRGVVRICATDNPGRGTEPERFQKVGHCGNENIRCWLDKRSVDNALSAQNVGAREETLEELLQSQKEFIESEEGVQFLDDGEIEKELGGVLSGDDPRTLDERIGKINVVGERAFFTYQKAEVLLTKGDVYALFARKGLAGLDGNSDEENANSGAGQEDSSVSE